jgi:hypothetical protein
MCERLLEHALAVDGSPDLGIRDDTRGPARDELDLAVLERTQRVVDGRTRLRLGHPADGHTTDDHAREDAPVIRPAERDEGDDAGKRREQEKDHGPANDTTDRPPEGAWCRGDRLCGGHP